MTGIRARCCRTDQRDRNGGFAGQIDPKIEAEAGEVFRDRNANLTEEELAAIIAKF
jgi:hypothetical protein